MSEGKERSVGSVGSVAVPDWDANGDPLPAGADKLLRIAELEAEVSRLRLTDAEREAVERLCEATNDSIADDKRAGGCHWQDDAAAVAVVRGLLARLGGE